MAPLRSAKLATANSKPHAAEERHFLRAATFVAALLGVLEHYQILMRHPKLLTDYIGDALNRVRNRRPIIVEQFRGNGYQWLSALVLHLKIAPGGTTPEIRIRKQISRDALPRISF